MEIYAVPFMKSAESGGTISGLMVTLFTFQDFMVSLHDPLNIKHFKGSSKMVVYLLHSMDADIL